MALYSTAEVAEKIGVSKSTLLRWLYAGNIAEPKTVVASIRIWNEAEVKAALRFKKEHYGKGRGRRKQR